MVSYPEKILVVDDEEGLLSLVKLTLNKEHYHNIICVTTGADALSHIENKKFDLIILDVMLPDYSGFDLCAEIRRHTIAPIVFLTARNSDYDKLSGLSLGGDDYITKPFNTMELVARIKAIFRRRQFDQSEVTAQDKIYSYGDIVLNMGTVILTVKGQEVDCTAKEMELLEFFLKHPYKVYTASYIYEAVWGLPGYGGEKTVSIHISKLRKKLCDDKKPNQVIINLRGIGYKFVPPERS